MKRGFCDHKDKKSRIVTEWKCVDIRYPDNISPEERKKRDTECRAKDWYGVCELCKYFIPDAEQPASPPAQEQQEKPTYAEPEKEEDPVWDRMMDELI